MKRGFYQCLPLLVGIVLGALFSTLNAQQDPGREEVGQLLVTVFYATNGDPEAAGERSEKVTAELIKKFESSEHLKFTHYRTLGAESQEIFRTYENWAQPLKPSDEILVRFEPSSKPTAEKVSLDLELWLSRKKILKTDAKLKLGHPLLVLGPEWRGGRLIISVALATK
ncbi:MAG: hypothetical protein AB8D78_10790 [Akkermansiaceae bacterium]